MAWGKQTFPDSDQARKLVLDSNSNKKLFEKHFGIREVNNPAPALKEFMF